MRHFKLIDRLVVSLPTEWCRFLASGSVRKSFVALNLVIFTKELRNLVKVVPELRIGLRYAP